MSTFLHRKLWRSRFGAKKSVFLHQMLLPAEFGAQEGDFLHRKLSGRKSPYSNSVVRKRYMVGNMNAALAKENITASAIGMPLDLRKRDASG